MKRIKKTKEKTVKKAVEQVAKPTRSIMYKIVSDFTGVTQDPAYVRCSRCSATFRICDGLWKWDGLRWVHKCPGSRGYAHSLVVIGTRKKGKKSVFYRNGLNKRTTVKGRKSCCGGRRY